MKTVIENTGNQRGKIYITQKYEQTSPFFITEITYKGKERRKMGKLQLSGVSNILKQVF